MRRTVFALVATVIGLIFLLGYKTVPATTSTHQLATSGLKPSGSTASAGPSKQPLPQHSSSTIQSRQYTGRTSMTPYGPVQVQITVSGGTLSDVTALQLPSGAFTSQRIAERSAPILRSEALRSGGKSVDVVSGATYTSEGYAESLQSALDQVHG